MQDELAAVLSFHKSRSSRYPFAVTLAQTFESYCDGDDEDGELVHSIHLKDELRNFELFNRFVSLVDLVSAWKKTTLTISGEVMPQASMKQISRVGECYNRQRRSGNPYHYCNAFDPRHAPTHFGCRLLTSVDRRPPLNGQQKASERKWYVHGELNGYLFQIDKKRILGMLEDDTQSTCAHLCPVFRTKSVEEEVAGLPDVIDIRIDSRFAICNRPDGGLGIRERTISDRSEGSGSRESTNLDQKPGVTERAERGKKAQKRVEPTDAASEERVIPQVTFNDVCGQDKAVSAVRDWVELPLRHPDLFTHVGVPTHVGILLYGPPGTGKTLLAQAVAGESNAHLEVINGPEILSKWVGQSEETMRGIFERAKRLSPSVILLDEIDAIAPARDKVLHGHEVTLVSQLLTLMDGLYDRGQVIVIATTNRLEALDSALRRPGRFDYTIRLGIPDAQGREAIFRRHLDLMSVSNGMEMGQLVERTDGMCGAEIAKVCRQAGLICVKEAILNGYTNVEGVEIGAEHLSAALDGTDRPSDLTGV
jgi:SpoVK/Ycf46/Vps4 family AAA+-type ATPase